MQKKSAVVILLVAFGMFMLGQTASEKTRDTSYPDHSLPFWPKYEKAVKGAATLVATGVPRCAKVENAMLFISDFDITKKQDPELPITSPERSIISVTCWGRPKGKTWFVRDGRVLDEKESSRLQILGDKLVDGFTKSHSR